jgi:hypothetical protein
MNGSEAIAEAQRLEKEAAGLSEQAHRKLREAARLRSENQGWLDRRIAINEAEVACWSPEALEHHHAIYGLQKDDR